MDCTSSAPFLLLYEPVLRRKRQNIHKSLENGSIYESAGAAAGMREAWGVLCRRQIITASVSKCKWDKWLRSICCGGPRLSILCWVRDVSSALFTPSPHCFDALITAGCCASERWNRRRMKTLILVLKDRNCAVCWDTSGMGFSSTRYFCLLSRWIHHDPEKHVCSCALAGPGGVQCRPTETSFNDTHKDSLITLFLLRSRLSAEQTNTMLQNLL